MTALGSAVSWLARAPARAFLLIFVVGFSIRATLLLWVPREYIVPHTRWEMEAIAVSLAQRGTFADPYQIPTGPTAHHPPVYPVILSLIYRVFGLTLTAGIVAWLLGAASYATTFALLPWFAGRVGAGREAGVLGGLAAALLPHWLAQAEALTGLVLCLLLVAFLRRWTTARSSAGGSLLFGLAWGAAFHLNPALLPVLLGCLAFELWWFEDPRRWRWSALLALGVLLACVPWGWRNYTTFHRLVFVRSNFGLELRVGNHPGATADIDVNARRGTFLHPRTSESEALQVLVLGEIGYMQQEQQEALGWIGEHPGDFLELTAVRVAYFWLGPLHRPGTAFWTILLTALVVLGAWRTLPGMVPPQRAVLVIPLLTFPLVYYLVAYMARYRVPVEWLFYLLAGAAVWHGIAGRARQPNAGDP
jgi:hypothetical protein